MGYCQWVFQLACGTTPGKVVFQATAGNLGTEATCLWSQGELDFTELVKTGTFFQCDFVLNSERGFALAKALCPGREIVNFPELVNFV